MQKNKIKNKVCSHHHSLLLDNWIRKVFQNPKKIISEYIKPNDTVIDIGCGPGFFTIEMAKLVSQNGKVIAVDLQPEMLNKVKNKAMNKDITNIEYHQCKSNKLDLNEKADFILAFYMIHETPDTKLFLEEVKSLMKVNTKLLVVEPKIHVSEELYQEMLLIAQEIGFRILDQPKGKGGRSVVFTI